MITIIPDIHGRVFWKKAVDSASKDDTIVFLGDYLDMYWVDSIVHDITNESTLENFREILEFKKSNPESDSVVGDWLAYVERKRTEELEFIIAEERLNPERTRKFVDQCMREGEVKETGTEVSDILPPMSMFSKDRTTKKARVIERLKAFFQKFGDISGQAVKTKKRVVQCHPFLCLYLSLLDIFPFTQK